MNDRFWDELVGGRMGFPPLTDEEAEASLDAVEDAPPMTPAEVERIMRNVLEGIGRERR